jgi:hypothetical protein
MPLGFFIVSIDSALVSAPQWGAIQASADRAVGLVVVPAFAVQVPCQRRRGHHRQPAGITAAAVLGFLLAVVACTRRSRCCERTRAAGRSCGSAASARRCMPPRAAWPSSCATSSDRLVFDARFDQRKYAADREGAVVLRGRPPPGMVPNPGSEPSPPGLASP